MELPQYIGNCISDIFPVLILLVWISELLAEIFNAFDESGDFSSVIYYVHWSNADSRFYRNSLLHLFCWRNSWLLHFQGLLEFLDNLDTFVPYCFNWILFILRLLSLWWRRLCFFALGCPNHLSQWDHRLKVMRPLVHDAN